MRANIVALDALVRDTGIVSEFSVAHSFADVGIVILEGLLHDFVHVLPVTEGFQIGISRGHVITQGPGQSVLFGFLDALDLVLPFPLCFLCNALCARFVGIALCIPVQISSSLPSADRRHKRMAQVVLAVGGRLYIRPLEIATATPGALLPDSSEQVHSKFGFGLLAQMKVEAEVEVGVEARKRYGFGFRFGLDWMGSVAFKTIQPACGRNCKQPQHQQ
jgi:hypothetical protein